MVQLTFQIQLQPKKWHIKLQKKFDQCAVKLIKITAKSQNVRAIAMDVAKITVSIIETGIKINDNLKIKENFGINFRIIN